MSHTKQRISIARTLRSNSTEVERLLWSKLRAGRLAGYPFKRQFPFGPYILDFACVHAKLSIEVDGSQHADNPDDKLRDAYITNAGWQVLRFWNKDINNNMNGVLEIILSKLTEAAPSPTLPRSAGEGVKK